jgi:hypothetical protein
MAAARGGGGEAIDALYERLDKFIENEQDKKALKTADESGCPTILVPSGLSRTRSMTDLNTFAGCSPCTGPQR